MWRYLFCAIFAGSVQGWKDCDVLPVDAKGGYATEFNKTYIYQGHPVYLQYPTARPPTGSKWPIVIFMHGMTLSWEWYSRHVEYWASHGFVVAFPFVKSEDKDDSVIPVTETDATSIHAAYGLLKGLSNGSIASPVGLTGDAIDVGNVGLAGHSMGGENVIRAAAQVNIPKGYLPFPQGVVKLAFAQHPSLCTFPPPYPYTISKAEINNASLNSDLFLFTAENDRAFNVPVLPATPETEYNCWKAASGPAIFASVKKVVCESYPSCKDMSDPHGCTLKTGFVGNGHMCACDAPGLETWTSPELKWVTAALRLYLHFQNMSSSACGALVWGDGPMSLASDDNMLTVERHGKLSADARVVLV